MPPASAKSPAFQSMVRCSHRLWFLHPDANGWACAISSKQSPPTFEELVDGWMAIPTSTPSYRDENGVWQYDVKQFTKAEAAEKVLAFLQHRRSA